MVLVPEDKIAEYTRRGWWGTETLWDLFLKKLAERADHEAVVDAPNRHDFAHGAPQRLSWRQLHEEVERFCRVVLQQGLRRDDIVVVQLPNCVEQS